MTRSTAPSLAGFLLVVLAMVAIGLLVGCGGGGKVYRRVINRGPEKNRAMAWAEVQPKP